MGVFVEFFGHIRTQTDKAVLFKSDGGTELWVPRSVLGAITYPNGDSLLVRSSSRVEAIELAEWFANKEGLGDGVD